MTDVQEHHSVDTVHPGLLGRVWSALRRPLWTEPPELGARRRCRLVVATPFAAIAGLAWGVLAAPQLAGGTGLLWGSLGAAAFSLFLYLEQRLMPPFAALTSRLWPRAGPFAALGWETAMVGGLFYLMTRILGAPTVPAVATALGIGAFYAVVMEYVVCGNAASDVLALVQGPGGRRSIRPGSVFTDADALMGGARYEEAAAIYRRAIEEDSRPGAPYVRLARAEVAMNEPDAAVATLRLAFARARLTPDHRAFVVRQIHDVCRDQLGDSTLALDDLDALLEAQPDGVHAEWARRMIREATEKDAG